MRMPKMCSEYSIPDDVLDIMFRQILGDAVIPTKHKKKKRKKADPIPEGDIARIAYSTGRHGYTTLLIADGKSWNLSYMQHGLRVWANSNWNVENPTVEGHRVLASMMRVLEEVRARSFIDKNQEAWLLSADPVSGVLPVANASIDAELIDDLYRGHEIIQPTDVFGGWQLTSYGREINSILARSQR